MNPYLFKSSRLGFRCWQDTDTNLLFEINNDAEVMEFFPEKPSKNDTIAFVKRMQELYARQGFCYFAVDKLENHEFIGFIGLAEQVFEADFTPCIDMGWRLKKIEWRKGYASEGAKACLDFAFKQLAIEKVMAIAPLANIKSEAVMKRIGMKKVKTFQHPKMLQHARLRDCVLYEITKKAHQHKIF